MDEQQSGVERPLPIFGRAPRAFSSERVGNFPKFSFFFL